MADNQRTEADEQMLKALFADDFKGMEDAIKNGASLNTPYNEHGTTPFMWICREHTDPSVYEWALQMGASVSQTDDCGHTPLHILARKRCAFFPCLDICLLSSNVHLFCLTICIKRPPLSHKQPINKPIHFLYINLYQKVELSHMVKK